MQCKKRKGVKKEEWNEKKTKRRTDEEENWDRTGGNNAKHQEFYPTFWSSCRPVADAGTQPIPLLCNTSRQRECVREFVMICACLFEQGL